MKLTNGRRPGPNATRGRFIEAAGAAQRRMRKLLCPQRGARCVWPVRLVRETDGAAKLCIDALMRRSGRVDRLRRL